jgi:uridine kinase/ribulose-5-phosphate 4-epimerase/fuculose-1-phosphate aldolase
MKKQLRIFIAGSSGVGKSTLAHLFSVHYADKKVAFICGDDAHKWPRGHEMWKRYTHLNPEANNLESEKIQLTALVNGVSIDRFPYCHVSGQFASTPVTIDADCDVLIYEGLHAFDCIPDAVEVDGSCLKIYVDTDEALKKQWKIQRDTASRGYTLEEVLETLKRREADEERYIRPQKNRADLVASFESMGNGVNLRMSNRGLTLGDYQADVKSVVQLHRQLAEFVEVCHLTHANYDLVQNKGGNVSFTFSGVHKTDQPKMIITGSGVALNKVTLTSGYSVVCPSSVLDVCPTNDLDYTESVTSSLLVGNPRPSMETGMHAALAGKAVVHTHPFHLNVLMCADGARDYFVDCWGGGRYSLAGSMLEYVTPGYKLADKVREYSLSDVLFLRNHGLICAGETLKEAYENSVKQNELAKKIIEELLKERAAGQYVTGKIDPPTDKFLFPDAAIFPEENAYVSNYILSTMAEAGLTPKFLTDEEVAELRGLDFEKYRKSLK